MMSSRVSIKARENNALISSAQRMHAAFGRSLDTQAVKNISIGAALCSVLLVAGPAVAKDIAANSDTAEIEVYDAAADYEDTDGNNTIIVTGASQGYAASNSVTATKTDTPLIDVPQTINVITRQQLNDQAQYSLSDVLRYVPGVTVAQGEGNRDQIILRGQNSTADFFLDGVRDDTQYYRGLYNLERVEILKGPYALIFGRGGGGGIVNRVQKSPQLNEQILSGRISANSFGAYGVSADLNTPIGDAVAVRLNANYEKLKNHRDFFDGERFAWNPYIAAKLNDDWKVGLSYEYVNDDRVVDRGIPSVATTTGQPNAPLSGARDQFFGVPGVNRTTLEAHIVKLRLDGNITENLEFSSTALFGDYDKSYTNVFANGAVSTAANTVAVAGYIDPTTRQNYILQGNLVWNVTSNNIDHKILLGAEFGDQESANQRRNALLSSGTINIAAPVFPMATFPAITRNTVSSVKFYSVYVQDQISISDHFDIIAGLRYDNFQIKGTDLAPVTARPFARTDTKLSPRFGLIYKPQENISLYGSYSVSFQPRSGDQFLTLTTTQENLAPEKFTNTEIGAKWDIHQGLSATIAAFNLDRTNATTPDPANPALTINAGETKVRGVEFSLTGRVIENWQMTAGYSYQDAKLRGNDVVRLGQVPKHQASLWNRYDFGGGFGLGLGVIHQSSQFAAIVSNPATTKLPAFTRVDAAAYYSVSDQVKVQLNIENILNEQYFSDAHNNNNISTGAPINGRLSVSLKF
jgi:catecholate siderophore receptor